MFTLTDKKKIKKCSDYLGLFWFTSTSSYQSVSSVSILLSVCEVKSMFLLEALLLRLWYATASAVYQKQRGRYYIGYKQWHFFYGAIDLRKEVMKKLNLFQFSDTIIQSLRWPLKFSYSNVTFSVILLQWIINLSLTYIKL